MYFVKGWRYISSEINKSVYNAVMISVVYFSQNFSTFLSRREVVTSEVMLIGCFVISSGNAGDALAPALWSCSAVQLGLLKCRFVSPKRFKKLPHSIWDYIECTAMQIIAAEVPKREFQSVCVCTCILQKWPNGPRSCLGWRLGGPSRIMTDGVPISLW